MKKANQKISPAILSNEMEHIFTETSTQKNVIADECGDTLWDEILKQDENKTPSETEKQNNKSVEDLNQLKSGEK